MGRKKIAAKRSPARKTAKRKATRRKAPSAPLGVDILQTSVVRDMQSYRRQLTSERALAELGNAPRRSASAATAGSRTRTGSLKYYIERVLAAGGTMSVKDITAAVLRAGFKTKNKTLGTSVGIALSQMPNVKKVARGKYALA